MSFLSKNIQQPSDYILQSSRDYSVYVCETRAIPRVCDGLKDGQRKALWLLSNREGKLKTFSLAGLMGFEKIYVHGETSANNAISLLAAPFCNNLPLITGEGQFGTRTAPVEGIGAPRYTDVRRSKAAEKLLYRDLDLVPMRDNYDGSTQEPEHFLPLIPLVLLNGVSGVAIGWSTEILPRKLRSLIAATQQALNGEPITGLDPHFDYLDISVKNIGPNMWEFSGKVEIVDTSTLRVVELPPELSIENFRKRLNKLEEDDLIQGYIDRSTEAIDITVKFRRGAIKGWKTQSAIDFFKLRQRVTERIVVIDWNGHAIRQYANAEQVVCDFAQWRLGWYTKRYAKLVADDRYEIKFWQAMKACFEKKLPARLNGHPDRAAIEADVITITGKIGIDEAQRDRIISLPTYRWAQDYYHVVVDKIAQLSARIVDHSTILASPERLREKFLDELDDLKQVKF